MRVLTAHDVAHLLPMADAIPLVARAFRLFSSGAGVYPLRTHLPLDDGDALVMPAYDGADALGVKLVTVHAGNRFAGLPAVRALYLLVAADGEPLMLCDAESLTAIRTGAASGVATDLLARRDARRGALFGAGAQARTQLEAVLTVRPLESVAVYARDAAHVRAFCQAVSPRVAARLDPAATPAEAVRGADVVITATTAHEPVFDGQLLLPGTHINAVGAYRADMRELDDHAVARSRVFVDSRQAALAEAGDLVLPMRAGVIDASHLRGELGDVLDGRIAGRETRDDVTLFKSVGIAAQDLVAAAEVYRRAEQDGVGAVVHV